MELVARLLERVSAEKRKRIERIRDIYTAGHITETEMHDMIHNVMIKE